MRPGIVKADKKQLVQLDQFIRRVMSDSVKRLLSYKNIGNELEYGSGTTQYLVELRAGLVGGVDPEELQFLEPIPKLPTFLKRWLSASLAMRGGYAKLLEQQLNVGVVAKRNPTFGSYVALKVVYKDFIPLIRQVSKNRVAVLVVKDNQPFVRLVRNNNVVLLKVVKAGSYTVLRPHF
jgi:hypothetical protein